MRKQIIRVSPVQTAKVMAALYFVMSIPFILLMAVMPSPPGTLSVWHMIIIPLAYLLFGFIFTLIGAWIYNLVAARVGGFEYTTVEVTGGDKAA